MERNAVAAAQREWKIRLEHIFWRHYPSVHPDFHRPGFSRIPNSRPNHTQFIKLPVPTTGTWYATEFLDSLETSIPHNAPVALTGQKGHSVKPKTNGQFPVINAFSLGKGFNSTN